MTIISSRVVEAGTDDDDVTTRDSRQTQPYIRCPPRRSRCCRDLRIGIPTPLPVPSSTTRATSSSWIHIDGSNKLVINRVQFCEQVFCAIGVGPAGPKHDAVESEAYGYYYYYVCDRSWSNDNNNRDESGVPTSSLCTIADGCTCSPQGSSQYGAGIEFT